MEYQWIEGKVINGDRLISDLIIYFVDGIYFSALYLFIIKDHTAFGRNFDIRRGRLIADGRH